MLALGEAAGTGFRAGPNGRIRRRSAMTNGDDIAVPDENVRFAELNTAFEHLSRAGDDEKPLAVLLDLGPLVAPQGILNGEVVEVEFALNPPQQVIGRLVEPEPNDMSGLLCPSARLRNGDVSNPLARPVDAGATTPASWSNFGRAFAHDPDNARRRFLAHDSPFQERLEQECAVCFWLATTLRAANERTETGDMSGRVSH